MYPQNPYQPGQTPQQPPQAPASGPPPLQAPPTPAPLRSPAQFGEQQSEAYPIDYLNQIAPTQQKSVNHFALLGIIGGVLATLIIAFVMISGTSNATPSTQMQQALARINTLQKVATSQQKHLTENSLNEANATLDSALSSMSTDLAAVMKQKGVKTTDSKSNASKTEADYLKTLQKKLDDSYQRGKLDRNYTAQMKYELTVLESKLKKLQTSGKSKSITAFCTTANTNIDAILKAYDTYDNNTVSASTTTVSK